MHYQRLRKTGQVDPRPVAPPRVCSVAGCTERADIPGTARGLCRLHYSRQQRTGTTDAPSKITRLCSVEGCTNKHFTGGLCNTHRMRLKQTGKLELDPKPTPLERFMSKVGQPTPNGCREWEGGRDKDGYGDFTHTQDSSQRKIKAHRFAYKEFVGPIPPGKMVLHSCDNPPCCEPSHLRVGTGSDNVQDALRRNRWNPPRGTRNPKAVLDEDLVRTIRLLHRDLGLGARRQSRILGINEGTIRAVLDGSNWKHVT